MLTVESLVADCGLELAAGAENGGRPLRWVHATEHADPTPWLLGGELILTAGYRLTTPRVQRRFVQALDDCGVAALGFGTGFDHDKLPEALVEEAAERGMPLFEVPYEMPFIAITERAARTLVSEQYALLERSTQVHERLERLVIEGGGLAAVTRAIAGEIGGAAVFNALGEDVARHPRGEPLPPALVKALAAELSERSARKLPPAPFEPDQPSLRDRALAVPVPARRGQPPAGWLVVVSEQAPLGDFERLIARQASIVVGLELMRERVVQETERRLAGDLLADALSGRLTPEELSGRLRPFGIGNQGAVLVFEVEDPADAEPLVEAALAELGEPALVATATVTGEPLLSAVIGGDRDPVDVARDVREHLRAPLPRLRIAASRKLSVGSLRRAFHEARCALEATSLSANGEVPEVASHRDLGAFTLLLSLQDDEALRLYADGLLEPIERGEGEYGGELLRSLEAFIEHNGNWERAARQLYCHRHTLRYRIRKIEELTHRDLSRATDRIELWLALRARELVR
jgi:purine catabolism regulator